IFSKYCAFAMVIAVALTANALPAMGKGTRGLATITGTVRDNKGAPLVGALVQLIREGAKQIIKQTYTAADGSFSARIPAGRYSLKAMAAGCSEVLFAGQTGIGDAAPQRFETTARMRVNDRHHLSLSGGGARLFAGFDNKPSGRRALGQMSVRAVDEWLVRDGVVVVMGLDYSRFTNAGGNSAISPRFGIQFDANARTRVKASYAPAGEESAIQSTASFEQADVYFKQPSSQPVAFVGGRAVMGQSRRL